MSTINIIKYICKEYGYIELSFMRLTKLLYFIDLYYKQTNNKQLTDVDWNNVNYEQFIIDKISITNGFKVINSRTIYKTAKTVVEYDGDAPEIINGKEVVDTIITTTKNLTWFELIVLCSYWETEKPLV